MTFRYRAALPALLLAAAASALAPRAAAQESTAELYGEFRYSYNRADAGDSTYWAGADNVSRLGVRGEISEGRLTAFVDVQAGANIDGVSSGDAFYQRYYLAGLRSPFGTLTVGRQTTAYKAPGTRLDPFFDTSSLSTSGEPPSGGAFGGATFGLSPLANGWADRTLAYTTPSYQGLTLNGAFHLDPESDHGYSVGAGYRGYGVDAGVQYHTPNDGTAWSQANGIDNALRLHAAYSEAAFWSLGLSYERIDPSVGDGRDYYYGSGTLNLTPDLRLAGALGHVSGAPISGTGFHAGAFYTLLPGFGVHALYSHLDADDVAGRGNVALGMTYQFSIAR